MTLTIMTAIKTVESPFWGKGQIQGAVINEIYAAARTSDWWRHDRAFPVVALINDMDLYRHDNDRHS